ncbi:hypothetical protein TNCV_5068401 [Trichonephila clavipes]|nr:hypothetical protein TNCV_5068401 [Trichonephila clavipes]
MSPDMSPLFIVTHSEVAFFSESDYTLDHDIPNLVNKTNYINITNNMIFQLDPCENINRHKMVSNVTENHLSNDRIRVVEDLDGTVESTGTIVILKTKIENSSTFESDPDFVKTLIQNCIDERVSRNEREATLEKQKIELAKLQLAQLEKEVELQTAKNEALSLNRSLSRSLSRRKTVRN